jgi:hypothetical protein
MNILACFLDSVSKESDLIGYGSNYQPAFVHIKNALGGHKCLERE